MKITMSDLSWPLKLAAIGGMAMAVVYMFIFLAGILEAFL